jgi:Domain of unknown function (DUF305)
MMSLFSHRRGRIALKLIVAGLIGSATSLVASTEELSFLAENDAAMKKMMAGMAINPSGSVDEDFVALMIPHHQGAVDMSRAELRYGHNEQLRRLAQEIIVTQQQEIAAMRLALGQPLGPSPSSFADQATISPIRHHRHPSGGPQ